MENLGGCGHLKDLDVDGKAAAAINSARRREDVWRGDDIASPSLTSAQV
jgi:hypothetical protein